MKRLSNLLCLVPVLVSCDLHAEPERRECLGRLEFDVPEASDWYLPSPDTFSNQGTYKNLTWEITSRDYIYYSREDIAIKVSQPTTREQYDFAVMGLSRGESEQSWNHQNKRIAEEEAWLDSLLRAAVPNPEHIKNQRDYIEKLKHELEQISFPPNPLAAQDAFMISDGGYARVLLWRNDRIYSFNFSTNEEESLVRAQALLKKFRPRSLYEVPEGSGFCFPYGFIADNGKPAYSIRSSMYFSKAPNVIMSMLLASERDPWGTNPTEGTLNTDYLPGYDASKWKKTPFIERLYFGKHLAGLEGWRLDPKPGSGEQERAWFVLAHTGGTFDPLMAVQVFTFQKGTDDLTDFTPPPEALLPRLMKLTKTMKQTLDGADR